MKPVRVRFAPSPTGPLHIGGLRTALFNYLFAKSQGGVFILRIEDTDQGRYVENAEEYIKQSLEWVALLPDESPWRPGQVGPYRQSERRDIYMEACNQLIQSGRAYYAFDTAEELNAMRERLGATGSDHIQYNYESRYAMRNSLTLTPEETETLMDGHHPYTIRLLVEPGRSITIQDAIRGEVTFRSDDLDDKILMKSDGMPTYHLANVVDDLDMQISHIIRGEEWLSSTAHHVLLYEAFNRYDDMPVFAHLPLILKPTGKGKLSKRDGARLGIPVFPMNWQGEDGEEFQGFREMGFLPDAVINFLALLGWSSGTDQEIFHREELIGLFNLEGVSKSGARFDFEKALWFNQQYIQTLTGEELAAELQQQLEARGVVDYSISLEKAAALAQPRMHTLNELLDIIQFLFIPPEEFDAKMWNKKWTSSGQQIYQSVLDELSIIDKWTSCDIKSTIEDIIQQYNSSYGAILPLVRIAITGSTQGPDIFDVMELLGRDESTNRLQHATQVIA